MTQRYEYTKLRAAITEHDLTLMQVAHELGLSNITVGNRLAGKQPWTLDEIYKLLSLLEIPVTDMHIYFPNRKANGKGVYLK